MSKATEAELATMHGEIAKGLTQLLRDGVPVVIKGEEGDKVMNVPASAAYYMAAITFAKNNNITADAGSNKELDDLTKALQERRLASKQRMTKRTVEAVAEQFERDLGDFKL